MTTTEPTNLTPAARVDLDLLVPNADQAIINEATIQALRAWDAVRPILPLIEPLKALQDSVLDAGGPDASEHLVEPIRDAVGLTTLYALLGLVAGVLDAARCEGPVDQLRDHVRNHVLGRDHFAAWITTAELNALGLQR